MSERVPAYKCGSCGRLFEEKEECDGHEVDCRCVSDIENALKGTFPVGKLVLVHEEYVEEKEADCLYRKGGNVLCEIISVESDFKMEEDDGQIIVSGRPKFKVRVLSVSTNDLIVTFEGEYIEDITLDELREDEFFKNLISDKPSYVDSDGDGVIPLDEVVSREVRTIIEEMIRRWDELKDRL